MQRYQRTVHVLKACIVCLLVIAWVVPNIGFSFISEKIAKEIEQEKDEESKEKEEDSKLDFLEYLSMRELNLNHARARIPFPHLETGTLNGFEKEMINPPD